MRINMYIWGKFEEDTPPKAAILHKKRGIVLVKSDEFTGVLTQNRALITIVD